MNTTRTVHPVAASRQSPYVPPMGVKFGMEEATEEASYCEADVTYLQFPIQVCFPCNDHAQPATPTSVTDTFLSSLVKLIVV